MRRGAGCLLPALSLATACALPPPEPVPASPVTATADGRGVDARALLLLMADRRQFDPFSVEVVRSEHPELWGELALALGRIGDRRGGQVLTGLLADERPPVRRRAAFALGRLGDGAAAPSLRLAVADADRETARRAVEALARLGEPLVRVVEAALPLAPEERWARLCPELFRFAPHEILVLAQEALAAAGPEDQGWAIYALARRPEAGGAELLRAGLLHPAPRVRAWAARGLGAVGDSGDLRRLRPLLAAPEAGPVVQALIGAGRLIADGRADAPAGWVAPLAALLDDRRPGVRLAAIEVAAHWLLEPRLGDELSRRAAEGNGRERELALLALAAGGDPRAEALVARAASAAEAPLRAAAAAAAGRLGLREILARLAGDRAAPVRAAALAARLEEGGARAAVAARRALIDADPGVRTAALEWLAEHPRAPLEEIALAMRVEEGRAPVELRLGGVSALVGRAGVEPLERGAVVALLEVLARDPDYPVRRAAADGLAELGRERPAPEPVDTDRGLDLYRDLARRAGGARRVELLTERGRLELELDCDAAPLTCRSFLQLAGQGFYDGLGFHRVVPDFVAQGGDPRGDGRGGPGFTMRDEPNLIRYRRGVVGMARSAPDTAGSQFFITLSPQHHLDGDYTAFGRVVAGDEVLDRIVQGDRIRLVREIGTGE